MASETPDAFEPILVKGRIAERHREVRFLPSPGRVKRYVLTSAQNNTHVHEAVWLNVVAMARHYDAELMVGSFSYDKGAYGRKSVKRNTASVADKDALWYDPLVVVHLVDEPVVLAPGLTWCGEMNILPTSTNPLGDLESYNGRSSNIIPHAKFAMSSVAGLGEEATKFNYSTGTVTQRNYIQKKAGLKAERFHGYGALLVEVLPDGDWFVRQLQATEAGTIRDLDLKADKGAVTAGNPIAALTPGDVHVRVLDPIVKELIWGEGGMVDVLRPRVQLLHDVIDFRSRNHHEIKDPLAAYHKWRDGEDGVDDEVAEVAEFLRFASRPWLDSVVVPSNHHEAMLRWLKEADWQKDPKNAVFYHKAWTALLSGVADVFEWAVEQHCDPASLGVRFLADDSTLVIAGTEVAQHGHRGLNGARGNHRSSVKLGRPTTQGHEHAAGIYLASWVSGTCTIFRVGYNKGASSWSQSLVIQYPEGTRSMVTLWKGRWRA